MITHPDKDKLTSELATRCSEACTRAAIAALVLTGISFSLLIPLKKLAQLDAVARYTALRLQLKYGINEILSSPHWKLLESEVAALGEDAKYWPMKKIQESCLQLDIKLPRQATETKWNPPDLGERAVVPPSGAKLFMTTGLNELPWTSKTGPVWKALNGLDEPGLREVAGKYSYEVYYRIVRWQTLVEQVKTYSTFAPGRMFNRLEEISKLSEAIDRISLAELEMLAVSELEDVSLFDKEPKSFGIAMPWMSERIGVEAAVPLVGVSLCVVAFYFWLFARHALRLGLSCVEGTLFAAANEDRKSRLIFVFTSLAPGTSLVLLARSVSSPWPIVACAVVTWIFSVNAARCCTSTHCASAGDLQGN